MVLLRILGEEEGNREQSVWAGRAPGIGGWPSPPGSLRETAQLITSCLLKHLLAVSELVTFPVERPGLQWGQGRKREGVTASSSVFSDVKISSSSFGRKERTVP